MAVLAAPFSQNVPSGPRVRQLSDGDIQNLLDAPKTARQRKLEFLQSAYEGQQYDGRPSFWSDDKPMQERRPCVQSGLVEQAIESNAAFAMGEGRFPAVVTFSAEDDDFEDDSGLDEDESKTIDPFNKRLIALGDLEQAFTHAYKMAMASRSVAFVLGFRAGLPFVDLIWSKLCTPEFGDSNDPTRVTKLTIRYRYTELFRDPTLTGGNFWTRVKEYLRVIDATADTTYVPVDVWEVTDPGVREGASAVQFRVEHGFGLCPVHWYARQRVSQVGTDPDGRALHDGTCCENIEQYDMAISQRHRAAVYAGDPQTVATGVGPDDVIGRTGRRARVLIHPSDMDASGRARGPMAAALYGGPSNGDVVRRGAGEIWRIESASARVDMLVLPEGALSGLSEDAKTCAKLACDNLGIVVVDDSMFQGAGDLSGRTLSFLFSKQINRVSQDRKDLGKRAILPVLNLFYRMILAKPDGVYLPGIKKAAPILQKFYRSVAVGAAQPEGTEAQQTATTSTTTAKKVWFAPKMELRWGDYFEPSDTDESTRVTTANMALTSGFILKQTAVEHVKGVFGISNVPEYVKKLDEEAQKKRDQLHEDMLALGPAANPAEDEDEGGEGGKPPAKPSPQQAFPFAGKGGKGKPGKPGAKKPPPPKGASAKADGG